MAKSKVVICPYCGETQPAAERCRSCAGLFEPLSRQATHNAMGPWFIRDPQRPFQPGCSYETLVKLIRAGRVTKYSIIRGPTTRQFWTVAKHVPGVAHVLGYCHQCDAAVDPDAVGCPNCGTPFGAYLDRNYLGLPDIRPLPGEATLEDEAPASVPVGAGMRRPAPMSRGGTLSRFATDEELFAPAVGPAQPASPDPIDAYRASESDAPAPAAPVPDASVQSYAAAAARRSLERRLQKERQLVRVLIVVVLVIIGLIVITNLSTIRSWFASAPVPNSGGAVERGGAGAVDGASSSTPPVTPPANDEDANGTASGESTETNPPANETDEANGSEPPSADDSAAAPPTGPLDPFEVTLREALDLAMRARQSARDAAERRADLERAIALISTIETTSLNESQRSRVAGVLAGLREDLERLELREFFPDR